VGGSPGIAMSGGHTIDDGEVAYTTDTTQFIASATHAWQEAMAIRDEHMPILDPEIGGLTFTPGTWRSGTPITMLTGTTVTLDGQGDHNSKFLFQVATGMVVGVGCKIVLKNGAKAENIEWAVGTLFTTGTDVDFKGSIMAGTAVTFGANTVLEGSILALSLVVFGAKNEVNGCIVALSAITFGAENYVSFVKEARTATDIDFPTFSNANDEVFVACIPLLDECPAACADLSVQDDMEALLNTCTQDGIKKKIEMMEAKSNSAPAVRRRLSEDHVGGYISMLPNQGGAGGQEERELKGGRNRMCETVNPTNVHILLCCYNKNAYSYCGSPNGGNRRRGLQETSETKEDGGGISAGRVEQYLPSISLECTGRFKALAEGYIATNSDATCFAAATDVPLLKCYAIMVTGGDDSELRVES
jgi:hypothetical protein